MKLYLSVLVEQIPFLQLILLNEDKIHIHMYTSTLVISWRAGASQPSP